jgi:DNA-binding SARP family transcriptional activator
MSRLRRLTTASPRFRQGDYFCTVLVERTIELAPYDDYRYLRAASTLLHQGRRGEALSVVKRARTALADLGLPPPAALLELERSIAWPATPEIAV